MRSLGVLRSGSWALAALAVGRAFVGCSSEFTCVDDRTCPPVSGSESGNAASGGTASGSPDAGAGGMAGRTGVPGEGGPDADTDASDAPSCESEQPDHERGVFVTAAGNDGAEATTCGTAELPCATIKKALSVARQGSVIYLDAGTYEEDGISLAGGVTLQGGWERRATGTWNRVCTPQRNGLAVIRAKSADRTLSAVNLGGAVALEALTIRSKSAAAAAGQSSYGIFATGTETAIVLREVAVDVATGGAGQAGRPGDDGANGVTDCAPGTGADGAREGPFGMGAPGGSFGPAGFIAGPGVEGGVGSNGLHGIAAPAAPCVACPTRLATCELTCDQGSCIFCGWTQTTTKCGTAGTSGCGGNGGNGGKPGTGGGSSVGVFAWNAALRIESGRIGAGAGGDGGPGGNGGRGGPGGTGSPGGPVPVCEDCSGLWQSNRPCEPRPGIVFEGGAPGGTGGSGKAGGPGGGGAGGHSYAIYAGGAAVVDVAAGVELVAGASGKGGAAPGAGADGVAKPIGP